MPDRPVGRTRFVQWIGHLNEVFENASGSPVGSPSLNHWSTYPEATPQLFAKVFLEKGCVLRIHPDIIVFTGKAGCRCIRILGVRLDLDYEGTTKRMCENE
jgi:hypothetical protein